MALIAATAGCSEKRLNAPQASRRAKSAAMALAVALGTLLAGSGFALAQGAAATGHQHDHAQHDTAAHEHQHGGAPAAQPALPDPLANAFGGKFSLIDHTGKPVTDETYRGRYMLIYFGYTNCPDLCPIDTANMIQALHTIDEAKATKIQPLFISVDPENDTTQVLANYVGNYDPRLIGLTGPLPEIERLAKAYKIHRHELLQHASTSHDHHLIDHGTLMFLMGPDGKFVTLFPHDTAPEKIAASLNRYVH